MHYKHRCIQKPFKHLRMECFWESSSSIQKWSNFAETVNGLKPLTGQAKTIHLRCLEGSEYASVEKQGRFKVCKKNSRRRYVKCKSTWCMFWNISMILANLWLCNKRFENLRISSDKQHFSFNYFEVRLAFFFFFFGFPIRRLSVTFDIQIDLKLKHS